MAAPRRRADPDPTAGHGPLGSLPVAAFGAAGDLGAFLGRVLVAASHGASYTAFALPLAQLAVVAPVSLTAGALAGLRPARPDVLRAVATE